MTSQLCQNFQASEAVHGAHDITTLHFQTQVTSLSVPKLKVFFTREGWSAQPYSMNFVITLKLINKIFDKTKHSI